MLLPAHGGDIYGYDRPLLDFSANMNPFGMPEAVARAAREAVADCTRYPDPDCRALTRAIARMDGVDPGRVLCGSGAADLIYRLVLACRPRRALVTAPTFSEYVQALDAVGCPAEHWPLVPEEGFRVTEGLLDRIVPGMELVFLCSPNNPTGLEVESALLERVLDRCERVGARLVVDECFQPLSGGPGLAGALDRAPHLFLLRAFTKSYAMPGLRLGYGLCGDRALLDRCRVCGQAWPVSQVAQAAGIAACACPEWPGRARDFLRQERPRLQEGLTRLGMQVWPGQANFLLFRAEGVVDLKERLVERGILIRSCANYHGLGPDYYRTAVRLPGQNDTLLREMKEVFGWQDRS